MRRLVTPGLALALGVAAATPGLARADGGTHDVNNVAVIDDATDGGNIVDGCAPGNGLFNPDCYCLEAAKVFYQTHCDDYDAIITFVDEAPPSGYGAITDTEQGTPVRNATDGIGRNHFDISSLYGSAGRLQQCVNMTYLTTKPDNPDAQAKIFGGFITMGITGIELVGHELGHHWLMGANFDLGPAGGNLGVEDLLRACVDNNNGGCDPNLHYAEYVNSHSVMYGNFLTDNGDGTFQVCGETSTSPRSYSKLDQYLMGLLPASQAPDPIIWALDDGTHRGIQQDGGNPAGDCETVGAPYTRVDVSVGDVIAAMGTRSGPADEIPTDWNVAFVLVAPKGVTPTQADLDKMSAYRTRFEQWFTTATDGLGHVHTEIQPNDCTLPSPPPPVTDGGTPDAGPPVVDAGTPDAGGVDAGPPDAGPPPVVDAGAPDAGVVDAGPPPLVDAGTPDAGPVDAGGPCGLFPCADAGSPAQTPDAGPGISTLHTGGCGCSATATGGTLVPALALVLLVGLRRRRRA